MNKYAVAIILAIESEKRIESQLYICNAMSKDAAVGHCIQHGDIKQAFKEGYVIVNTNVAEIFNSLSR